MGSQGTAGFVRASGTSGRRPAARPADRRRGRARDAVATVPRLVESAPDLLGCGHDPGRAGEPLRPARRPSAECASRGRHPRPGPDASTGRSPVRSRLLQASLADRDDGSGGPSRLRRRAGTQGATKTGACARFKRSPRCHCGDATRRMAGSPLRGPRREAVSVSGERSVSRIKAGSRRSPIAGSPFHPQIIVAGDVRCGIPGESDPSSGRAVPRMPWQSAVPPHMLPAPRRSAAGPVSGGSRP